MRFLHCVAVLVASSVMLLGRAAPLTIAQAFDPEGVNQAALSPDGKSVALLFFDGQEYQLRFYFILTDITKTFSLFGEVKEVQTGKVVTPRRVTWASNDLLALDYGSLAISVNRQGKIIAELGREVIRRAELGESDSSWVLVYTDADRNEIALVNAKNGEKKVLPHPPGELRKAAFDRHGEMRAVTLLNTDAERGVSTYSNWYLPAPGKSWQKLEEFGVNEERWLPAYVPDKPNTLAVYSRAGRDTYAYFAYDTERRVIGEMLAGHPTEDILSVKGAEQASYEQVITGGMRTDYIWLNGAWAGVQQSVDAVLPGRANLLSGNPHGKVLVYSYSDTEPGEWHLLDRKKGTMRRLVQSHPATAGAGMRPMEIMRYAADDGLNIPAFLTRPADGAKNTPLVVLIHGGPWVRDYWGWDPEVQLLASQGYTVFQPQFRGSTGFGKYFEQAGYGQWGLAMQDDITAGVRHLIARGIADPKKICIVGGSYGGYAALWGLVKTPELYQCGVSFAGVADIEFMFNDNSDRAGSKVSREILMTRIGAVGADPQRFDQVSPLKHADRIRAPVLLMHGEDDQRVPISHGLKMKAALESRGKHVEWLSFAGEGHGLRYLQTTTQYYQTMLTFLDKYIGKLSRTPEAEPKEH
jgi:dipeptidyl aminopeptidase/acylaminoacyl peptidase